MHGFGFLFNLCTLGAKQKSTTKFAFTLFQNRRSKILDIASSRNNFCSCWMWFVARKETL
ncbi:hypothetical protein Pint_07268 [Pistacia integerrima]|uniref:Uncharacterized protein n=1 Tax=Pistacia integerrima TaxID=434235 RepID=A0ACC0XVU6_9ROSI|nr:hypothetical protein Pint_07268 [Pistacia integerrima]